MKNPKRDDSMLESEVEPFLKAAVSDSFKNVLKIFFINHKQLMIYPTFKKLILVSMNGEQKDINETIEILSSKCLTELGPLFYDMYGQFPEMLRGILTSDDKLFIEGFIKNFKVIQTYMDKFEPMILVSFMIITERLLELRKIQESIIGNDYEDILRKLFKLEVLRPILKISFCPNCNNYEFIISNFPNQSENCPKCEKSWFYIIIYIFNEGYQKIKQIDADLSLFVSSYLKLKTSLIKPFRHIYPSASYNFGEIDVCITDNGTGIECKAYEDIFMPDKDIEVRANEIKDKIEIYKMLKVKKMFLITNLRDTEKLHSHLENVKDIKFEIIPGDIFKILEFLDKMAEDINTLKRNCI